jgi:hypothetical protein
LWGLDKDGDFRTGAARSAGSSWLTARIRQLRGRIHADDGSLDNAGDDTNTNVRQLVTSEQQKVRRHITKEFEFFQAASSNNKEQDNTAMRTKEQGRRLLYLFQKDLLPGINGQIVESKKDRDRRSLANVAARTKEQKRACWAFLCVAYIGMLFYILLFSLEQSGARQFAWFKSFLMWFALDVCLVCTGMVYITHMLIPMIAMRDIAKIQQKLLLTIKEHYLAGKHKDGTAEANNGVVSAPSPHSFNAAEYLFVSYRLAQFFPKLAESAIILRYVTIWPKQSYQHHVNVSRSYGKKYSTMTKLTSLLLVYGVSNLVSMPSTIHDLVMHIVTTTTIGYAALLHLQLWAVYPALVVAPALLVLGAMFVVIRGGRTRAKAQLAQVTRADDDSSVVGKQQTRAAERAYIVKSTDANKAAASTRRSVVAVATAVPGFTSRRDSLRAGQLLVHQMQQQQQQQHQFVGNQSPRSEHRKGIVGDDIARSDSSISIPGDDNDEDVDEDNGEILAMRTAMREHFWPISSRRQHGVSFDTVDSAAIDVNDLYGAEVDDDDDNDSVVGDEEVCIENEEVDHDDDAGGEEEKNYREDRGLASELEEMDSYFRRSHRTKKPNNASINSGSSRSTSDCASSTGRDYKQAHLHRGLGAEVGSENGSSIQGSSNSDNSSNNSSYGAYLTS